MFTPRLGFLRDMLSLATTHWVSMMPLTLQVISDLKHAPMILFIHSFIYLFIYLKIRRKAKASEAPLGRGDSPCSSFVFACSLLVLLFILLLLLFLLFLLLLLLCFLLQNLIRRRHPIKRQIPTQKRTTSVCSLREKSLSIESQVYSDVSWRKGVWTKHACDADATWRRCHPVSMCWVTLPRHSTAQRTSNRRRQSCARYTSKSCASTQSSLSFSCFDGIIMRHTTSGCTYKRDVSRRPCFASRQPSEPVLDAGVPPEKYVLLCLLAWAKLFFLITQLPLLAELKAFMLRYCSQCHWWQQMITERTQPVVSFFWIWISMWLSLFFFYFLIVLSRNM